MIHQTLQRQQLAIHSQRWKQWWIIAEGALNKVVDWFCRIILRHAVVYVEVMLMMTRWCRRSHLTFFCLLLQSSRKLFCFYFCWKSKRRKSRKRKSPHTICTNLHTHTHTNRAHFLHTRTQPASWSPQEKMNGRYLANDSADEMSQRDWVPAHNYTLRRKEGISCAIVELIPDSSTSSPPSYIYICTRIKIGYICISKL